MENDVRDNPPPSAFLSSHLYTMDVLTPPVTMETDVRDNPLQSETLSSHLHTMDVLTPPDSDYSRVSKAKGLLQIP